MEPIITTNRCTKVVLTVIAGGLLFNIARNTIGTRQAFADSGQTHVIIDGTRDDAAVPVGIRYPVNSEALGGGTFVVCKWDPKYCHRRPARSEMSCRNSRSLVDV
jgi:hypothetical protein